MKPGMGVEVVKYLCRIKLSATEKCPNSVEGPQLQFDVDSKGWPVIAGALLVELDQGQGSGWAHRWVISPHSVKSAVPLYANDSLCPEHWCSASGAKHGLLGAVELSQVGSLPGQAAHMGAQWIRTDGTTIRCSDCVNTRAGHFDFGIRLRPANAPLIGLVLLDELKVDARAGWAHIARLDLSRSTPQRPFYVWSHKCPDCFHRRTPGLEKSKLSLLPPELQNKP